MPNSLFVKHRVLYTLETKTRRDRLKPLVITASKKDDDDGDTVVVESRVGSLEITMEKTDAMMSGVVSIPHGFGHGKKGSSLDVANKNAGVSINDLTDEEHFDSLTGNAGFSGVPVEVKRAGV